MCQGIIIKHRFILTSSSCIYGPKDKYRVRIPDSETKSYNEYEPCKNCDQKICKLSPISYDYGYGSSDVKLVLLQIDACGYNSYEKHPGHICLPSYYEQYYPKPPHYSPEQKNYEHSAYHAAPPPTYPPPPQKYESECWVAGWYGSPQYEYKKVSFI